MRRPRRRCWSNSSPRSSRGSRWCGPTAKYHNYELYAWLARQRSISWRLEIVRRPDGAQGFVLLPKRWVVERTFSWLGRWRRLSRDYEHRSASSECMVRLASIGRMLRRLAPAQQQVPFKYRVAA